MKIRPAKLSDAPNIAKLGTLAFAQDPSYGHFYPWRQQYPEDFYQKLLYNYKLMIVTPGEVIMVVELDDEDEMESTENLKEVEHQGIVGYATFRRSGGTEEEHAKWNADSTSKAFTRWTLKLSGACSSVLRPNRAMCKAAQDCFWSQAFKIHATTQYTGKLDFLTLAILPGYQRRGVGQKILEYAGNRANEEKIPMFGDATEKGLPLYLKVGGKQIGTIIMPEHKYEKSGRDKMPITVDRLETPVLRWDAANLPQSRFKKVTASAKL